MTDNVSGIKEGSLIMTKRRIEYSGRRIPANTVGIYHTTAQLYFFNRTHYIYFKGIGRMNLKEEDFIVLAPPIVHHAGDKVYVAEPDPTFKDIESTIISGGPWSYMIDVAGEEYRVPIYYIVPANTGNKLLKETLEKGD